MKNPKVCKGCKYRMRAQSGEFKNVCNYIEITGRSRLVVERENGGYKTDSCICYEAGTRKRGGKRPKVG